MIFSKKILTISLLLTSILVGTVAYALVGNAKFVAQEFSFSAQDTTHVDTTKATVLKTPIKPYKQDTYEDLTRQYPADAPTPDNVKTVVEFDPKTGYYIMRTKIGEMEITTPFAMTEQEYQDYSMKKAMQAYWQEKNAKDTTNNEKKFSISDMKFEIPAIDKIFGPGGVQVKTQGSAELIFGLRRNKVDNPTLPQRQRDVITFDFDEKIQINVNGKVGNKINFGLNYNTESTFDFDKQLLNLKYQPPALGLGEDDIIRSLDAGNVSMQLNSSLISGSTALFGIKTELQFGRLSVQALVSQQQSQTQTVSSKGSVQTTEFEVSADSYDQNRHFFLSHFFRQNYQKNLKNLPAITSGVVVKRVEVWITNKRGQYDQARNVVALMDLGEPDSINNPLWNQLNSIAFPQNRANDLYEKLLLATPAVRDIKQTNTELTTMGLTGGEDYEKLENARLLSASDYTLNSSLGYISLRTQLQSDEVLAVAYEYEYGGQTYQVGEFSTGLAAPQALIVKLLKGTTQDPSLKTWWLMMRNIYSLGAFQIQQENFKLNIIYRNDSVGTDLQYISEGDIKNQLLLRVMNLDRLNSRNKVGPDGRFDFVEGYTIEAATGRIIFPVLEPFGSWLRDKIGDNDIANKYCFDELYTSSVVDAMQNSEKNKFKIVGEYQASSSGAEISLGSPNVARGSVTVLAGGRKLIENVDYTVDYQAGRVKILNQSLVESATNIEVKLENQNLFSLQRKTLLGTHLEYKFNKDFSIGGTIMHLSETPLTTKVNIGNEPMSNTIWGANVAWRKESQFLTNVIDKLPFVNATQPSSIVVNGEFAQLIPGHSKVVGGGGLSYIDDFEAAKTSIDLHYPYYWQLASTPSVFPESKLSNNIEYGFNRAHLAWFYVDNVLNSGSNQTPTHLKDDLQSKSDHFTRKVRVDEVFPNKETSYTETSLLTPLNLSYYPAERGMYNLDTDNINPDGTLKNPETRWGGIMRRIDQTDFENSNIEYIEFWLLDPFIKDKNNQHEGGELHLNLGDVSEDILKDGKKFFENGLDPTGDLSKNDTTVWGYTPKTQSTVNAFDNTAGARANQDVGFDGMTSVQEKTFSTYSNYLARLRAKLDVATIARMETERFSPLNDPSGDDYHFYRGADYDEQQLSILDRYKHYNGVEGNSPDAAETGENFSTSATTVPDVEDINGDNTLNDYEKYFDYRIVLKRDSMNVGNNFIADKLETEVTLENGSVEHVTWYQFRVPLNTGKKVGNILGFKSIRFMRLYLTDFKQDIFLRFASLDLVRGEWRTYNKVERGFDNGMASACLFDVEAVNIEENADKTPVNYVLPPGISRQTDPGQPQLLQQNEQAMLLRVRNLTAGEAKAVYKNMRFDMRQYKRLQMFVHAEKLLLEDTEELQDNDLACFIRLGSDLKNNYYEYEIKLRLTDAGNYSNNNEAQRWQVWKKENMFDFPFTVLTDTKLKRNREKASISQPYADYDELNNKITVVGNPSISEVDNIMIGVRNISKNLKEKSGEIWVNEMRMSEFDEEGGWAAMGNMILNLSDLGSINFAGRTETAGFGGIESNVLDRRLDNLYQMNFSTSIDAGRFLPEQAKIQLPVYFSYTNETLRPKYNPLDQDILLDNALKDLDTKHEKDSLLAVSQTVQTSKSFNIASAKVNIKSKEPQFYDPANITFGYAQTETNRQSADIERDLVKTQQANISYNYSFNVKPFEPFKNKKSLDKPAFKIIKELNFNYAPNSISYTTTMNRQFMQTTLRNFDISSNVSDFSSFSSDFMWSRQFDIKYNPMRSLQLGLTTTTNSNIEEGNSTFEVDKDYYDKWRDTVWQSIKKLGTPYTYQQIFTASWTVPINKLPLLDFINQSTATYTANYNWDRGAEIIDGPQIGNIATSRRDISLNAGANFEMLYNKSKFLQNINKRYGAQQRGNQQKFQAKTFTQTSAFEKDKKISVNHRLGSDKIQVAIADPKGTPLKYTYKVLSNSAIEITPLTNADSANISIATIDPNERSFGRQVMEFSLRTLMMLRNVSVTYRQSSSLTLPGFKPEAGFMGQQSIDGIFAPGLDFAFGLHDEEMINRAVSRGWLIRDSSVATPAIFTNTEDWDFKANIEPIPDLKIALTAQQHTAKNKSVLLYGQTMLTGSFNMTILTIKTAFQPLGDNRNNYHSAVFDQFIANRNKMIGRLQRRYENTNYPNAGFLQNGLGGAFYDKTNGEFSNRSPEVLIPAFFAAYTGKDVEKVETSPILSLLNIFPNWRVTYNGLSRIPFVKKNFNSVSLTHNYTSTYNVGNYTSQSSFVPMSAEEKDFGYIKDEITQNPIPSSQYAITTVTISEHFAPLIGINATLKNSMTAKLEYKKQRTLALNITSLQLIETDSKEFVIGAGYTLKEFDVILRLKNNQQSKIKNDLKLNVDVSYRDTKSLLRKLEEGITQASNGNKIVSIKMIADYVFSSKMNIQLFYDQQITTPLISTSYPVNASNFGISFKFMLTR